jgi:hypothetical protein
MHMRINNGKRFVHRRVLSLSSWTKYDRKGKALLRGMPLQDR